VSVSLFRTYLRSGKPYKVYLASTFAVFYLIWRYGAGCSLSQRNSLALTILRATFAGMVLWIVLTVLMHVAVIELNKDLNQLIEMSGRARAPVDPVSTERFKTHKRCTRALTILDGVLVDVALSVYVPTLISDFW